MKVVAQEEWQRCSDDLLYWIDAGRHLLPYVYTADQHPMHECKHCSDGEAYTGFKRQVHLLYRHKIQAETEAELREHFTELDTIRIFPMRPYIKPIAELWMREPLVVIEKSRDVLATWMITAFYTWDTIFHRGRQQLFQSETSQKTRDLVKRAFTIYRNQPRWLQQVHKAVSAEGQNRSGIISVDSLQSEIIGLPQGISQVRQYHPSGVFSDEAAFNPEAGESFAAIKPSIQNGGRYTAISSANPGWFHRIARDVE